MQHTGDETELDSIMITEVRDQEGWSKSSGDKDGGEQADQLT